MDLSFLTPAAALVGLLGLLALAMLVLAERRSRRVCAAVGLPPRPRHRALVDAAAIVAIASLLALAAAQPVASSIQQRPGRSDAQVIAVLDVSRSMLARSNAGAPHRLERSRAIAKEVRSAFPEVEFGITSLTDRVLPHLFPSLSQDAFNATIDLAVDIERPPPDRRASRATALAALGDLARNSFYDDVPRRIALVLTDGESVPVDLATLRARLFGSGVASVIVHVWRGDESVYRSDGAVERAYRPDRTSRVMLGRLAAAVDGRLFDEAETARTIDAVDELLATGSLSGGTPELRTVQLAPYTVLMAALPLLFLLARRNF
jgi:hypothetical protein